MALCPCSLQFSFPLEAVSRKLFSSHTSQFIRSGIAAARARLVSDRAGWVRCLVKAPTGSLSPGFILTFPVALWPTGVCVSWALQSLFSPCVSIWDPWGLLTPGPQYFLFPCCGTLSRASTYWPAAHILGLIFTKPNAFKSRAEPPGLGTACRADSCEVAIG